MNRPLIQDGIAELERLFEQNRDDAITLRMLESELTFRSVPRAVTLLQKVRRALAGGEVLAAAQQEELFEKAADLMPPPEPLASKTAAAVTLRSDSLMTRSLSVEDAYTILGLKANSSWDDIEHARRQLVDQARPDRLKSLSAERRLAVQEQGRMANAAHQVLFHNRST